VCETNTPPLLYPPGWTDYELNMNAERARSREVIHQRLRSEAEGIAMLSQITGNAETQAPEYREMITMLNLQSDIAGRRSRGDA